MWGRAEKAIQKIILKVQPTNVSEERRNEVIDYVQGLIRNCIGCEAFPYGSVPLKTYLPDGDIDLTAFGGVTSDDGLAEELVAVLEREEQNKYAEFVVKDVQLIRAEVKIVKCIVQNIVVDISFNQIGGICTLCFLEQVDRLIGKDHLFKRSIILVKAWCFYESRILGAYHGLFSTYALETLVLYIFHQFHSSLNGPLTVLYKFLDYFSKFDWENYCISLSGPVRLSSLPEFVVEMPDNGGRSLLLTDEFLRPFVELFSVPSRGVDLNFRTFQPKHLNIIDPLKENNNLGRSIHKGNFSRIRSAFTYGARKLGQLLMEPQDDIDEGLRKFFFNTLYKHGRGQRSDVQGFHNVRRHNGFGPAIVVSEAESCPTEKLIPETEPPSYIGNAEDCRSDHDLATSGLERLEISDEFSEHQDLTARESAAPLWRPYYPQRLYFSRPAMSNGDNETNNSRRIHNGRADLSGDYDSHFINLLYGRDCLLHLDMAAWPMNVPSPSPFQMMNSQDGAQQSSQFMHNGFSDAGMNGVVQSPGFYMVNPFLIPGMAFGLEEMPKTRGTGTYLPHRNRQLQGYRPQSARGRNQASLRSHRNNNRNAMFVEKNVADHGGIHESSQSLVASDQSGSRTAPSDVTPSFSPRGKLHPEAAPFERRVPRQLKSPSLNSSPQNSSPVTSPSGMQKPKPAPSRDCDRLSMKSSYHLKNEDDFPPLTL